MAESRRRENEILRKSQGELGSLRPGTHCGPRSSQSESARLSARLLQLQDDERRRIARELHDSVGQMLAALNMNLSIRARRLERLAKTANALVDSENLDSATRCQNLSSDFSLSKRALSFNTSEARRIVRHLLHPPLLDEAGACRSALRWYVGLASPCAAKLKADLDLPDDFGRLPRESETANFSSGAGMPDQHSPAFRKSDGQDRLRQRENQVIVEIADKGKGIRSRSRRKRLVLSASGSSEYRRRASRFPSAESSLSSEAARSTVLRPRRLSGGKSLTPKDH